MDNKKIAEELVKIAKELQGADHDWYLRRMGEKKGRSIMSLYEKEAESYAEKNGLTAEECMSGMLNGLSAKIEAYGISHDLDLDK